MTRRIVAFFLVLVMFVFSLPFSAVAADKLTDNALVEQFTSMLSYETRIEGAIALYFKDEVSDEAAYDLMFEACAFAYGTRSESVIAPNIDFNDGFKIHEIKVPDEKLVETMVMLWKSNLLSVVQPNVLCELDDVEFVEEYDPGVPHISPYGQWHLDRIGVQNAWDAAFVGRSSTIVAVLDTGCSSHFELTNIVDFSLAYNVVDNNTDVTDLAGHGTFVAGIIGSAINGEGTNGVCANVKIAPIKIVDANRNITAASIAMGINKAAEIGATVVNLSCQLNDGFQFVKRAADSFGKLIVFSAGNTGNELSNGQPKANDEPLWIIVGASNYGENIATYSCYSEQYVDLFAPGSDILSLAIGPSSSYTFGDGTSYSAPMVAAAVAILSSHATHLTPLQIKNRLMNTVDLFDAYNENCVSGGRLNLYSAVLATYNEFRGTYTKGDVDGDGFVTSTDVALTKSIVLHTTTPTAQQLQAADVNMDGQVRPIDYITMQRYVSKTLYFIP